MPENSNCNFLSRLRFLLGRRDEYPWGAALGLSHSQINAMFKQGILPKGQTLLAIQRRENANISWLLEGAGAPYLVEHCRDDAECRAQARLILEEPGWSVAIAGDDVRQALILTLPCSYQQAAHKRKIEYVELHILTNAGPRAIEDAAAIAAEVRTLTLAPPLFDDLISGHLGAYRLLGDEKSAGLMSESRVVDDMIGAIAETSAHYTRRFDTLPIAPDENALLDKYRRLSVADRSRVQTITDALAAQVTGGADDAG